MHGKGFINPRSHYIQYWDITTAIALFYTCFVTPFEVGIGLSTEANTLFVINQLVNFVFIADLLVQFVMPVPDPKTGELIRNHKKLAKKYLRGWFTPDFISVLPVDVIVVAAPSAIPEDNQSLVRTIRLLRVLRLFKLIRVLRASRIIQRWENNIAVSTSTRSIVAAWISFLVVLHWFACFWALLPQLVLSWRDHGMEYDPPLHERMALRIANDATVQCTACDKEGNEYD